MYNGITVGDQSLFSSSGPVLISSGVADSGYLRALEVYRDGLVDIRAGLTIQIPPENEETGFEPRAINVSRSSHLNIRNRGEVDIQGPVAVHSGSTANIDGGFIGGDIDTSGGSSVALGALSIEGGLSAESGSSVVLSGIEMEGDLEVSLASALEVYDSTQTDGSIALDKNSAANFENSSVGEIVVQLASSFSADGGHVGGAQLSQGAYGRFAGTNVWGSVRLFAPSNIVFQQEDGSGSLNGNTIYLCGNTSSFIDNGIRMTGPVVDGCLGNPYQD